MNRDHNRRNSNLETRHLEHFVVLDEKVIAAEFEVSLDIKLNGHKLLPVDSEVPFSSYLDLLEHILVLVDPFDSLELL